MLTSYLQENISVHSLIWLFLAAFMIHDLEEIIVIEPWMKKNHKNLLKKIPGPMRKSLEPYSRITSSQFAFTVSLEFLVFVPTTYLAAERGRFEWFIGFNAVMLIHVFTHLFQSIYVGSYTPGVVTAVAVAFPYTYYLFNRLVSTEHILTWSQIGNDAGYGLVLLPIVWGGHTIGRHILKN